MVRSKHTFRLFNTSGCLSLDAINRYHSGRLSNKDLEIIRKHMEECEMCRDAVEGYKHFSDQKRQLELMNALRKKIRSRYSTRPARVPYGRVRRLNPTLTYISAAATILIILGIYGLVTTGIFHHENYIAEQILEEEVKSEDQLIQAEKPPSELQTEVPSEQPQQPDTLRYLANDQEPELTEEMAVITLANEMADEGMQELDLPLVRTDVEMIPDEPVDTLVIEGVRNVAGVEVERISVAGESAARKAIALPVKVVSADVDVETRMEIEDSGGIKTSGLFFTSVDEMPQFSGNGYQDFYAYIRKNLKYPENAKERGITGEVLIQFIVNKYGKVEEVKAIQVVDSLLDNEAIRVVKSSPRWKPGTKNGEKVNVQLVYPVIFE